MGLNRDIPVFRRARDYHLYDDRGNRYLDLYQNDGRALMGHRPGHFSQYMKNSISRGLWADYPPQHQRRLFTLIKKLFPPYAEAVLFRNRERALAALDIKELSDPLKERGSSYLWRPELPDHPEGDHLFLRLPVAGLVETQIVLSRLPLPEGDEVSPILVDALVRLFHDYRIWRTETLPPKDFSAYPSFSQRGPYLAWNREPENYQKIFREALEKGLLIPPQEKYPLVIPRELSDYEERTLRDFLEDLTSTHRR